MQRDERVGAQRQPSLDLERGRQRVGPVARVRERGRDELAQLRGRDLLARRIDGREVRGRGAAVQVVGAHLEAVAVRRAAQPHARARHELLLQPRLVEPGRRDLAGAVRDLRRQDPQPAAAASGRRLQHLALDQHLLLAEEVGDPPLRRRLLVPARAVGEQVAHRARGRASRAASAAPGRRRAASRAAPRAARAGSGRASAASRPRAGPAAAKPGGSRRIDRVSQPGPAWTSLVLEPEEADRARPRVRADDRAERGHELDLGLRARLASTSACEQRDRARRASACAIPTWRPSPSVVAASKRRRNSCERLLAAADARQRHDLAVRDRQDRLHVEQAAGERPRPADPAALRQELERVDGEEQAGRCR